MHPKKIKWKMEMENRESIFKYVYILCLATIHLSYYERLSLYKDCLLIKTSN